MPTAAPPADLRSTTRAPATRRRRSPRSRPFDVRHLLAHGRYDSVSSFARDAGVDRRTVHRWIASGIDADTADRLAVQVLGCHPFEVFGRAWFDLDEPLDEPLEDRCHPRRCAALVA